MERPKKLISVQCPSRTQIHLTNHMGPLQGDLVLRRTCPHNLWGSLIIVGLLIFFPIFCFCQDQVSGSIEGGVVFADTELPAPNVTITIRDQFREDEYSVITKPDGTYFIPFLQPGLYTISCKLDGYIAKNSLGGIDPESVAINISTNKRLKVPPFILEKVTAAQPSIPQVAIETEPSPAEQIVNLNDASRGGNFDRKQLEALPFSGIRSFDALALLLPGVAPAPQPIGGRVGPGIGAGVGTSGQFSANGMPSRSNNFTVDGSDNNDEDIGVRRQGFTSLVPQSIESLEGVHISTLLPTSQYGRNMGGQVNAVSQAGTKGLHGTVYGLVTDYRLNAKNFFDYTTDGSPATYPVLAGGRQVMLDGSPLIQSNPVGNENPFTRGQYGFVLGGPVGLNQSTYFFTSLEHQKIDAHEESHFAVPTVTQRGLLNSGGTGIGGNNKVSAFPTSITGDAFFSLFPFPNNPIGPYGPNTHTEILPANSKGTIFSLRFDHKLGLKHNISARHNITDDETILPVTGRALFSTLKPKVRINNLSLFSSSAISFRSSNQARFSFGRTNLDFEEVRNSFLLPSRQSPNTPFLLNTPLIANVTLPGRVPSYRTVNSQGTPFGDIETAPLIPVPGAAQNESIGPIGQMKVSGFSPLGVDVFNFPQQRTNKTYQFANTFLHDHGQHRITTGFDIRRTHLDSNLERNFRPLVIFNGAKNLSREANLITDAQRSAITQVLGTNFLQSKFLLGSDLVSVGSPNGFFQSQRLVPSTSINLRYWQAGFFLMDQIKIHQQVTLTLGIRYEVNTVPTEKNDRIENTFWNPEIQKLIDPRTGRNDLVDFLDGRSKIYRKDANNWAPHIAFAWDPTDNGRTAIRGGYGIYYVPILGSVVSQSRNVFPNFLTLNFAGLNPSIVDNGLVFRNELGFFNPAKLALPDSQCVSGAACLNQYFQAVLGSPSNLILNLDSVYQGRSAGAAGATFTLPIANLETPYAQHWNLTLEQEVPGKVLLSAAYVGTRGLNLHRFSTPNLGPNAIPLVEGVTINNQFQPVFQGVNIAPMTTPGSFTGRPLPLLGPFQVIQSDASSNYHGLQVSLNKKFSRDIQFTTAYTWSHAIDMVSDLFDLAGTPTVEQNSLANLLEEQGDANFDVRQRFVYSFIWDLPGFKKKNLLWGGWQLSSIGTLQTGQPYSKILCCDFNLDGNLTDRIVPNGDGMTFNAARNRFRAPGLATVDLALTKKFRFARSQSIDFRVESFNIFNRTHFGIPINEHLFPGQDTSVNTIVPARTIQLGLKYHF